MTGIYRTLETHRFIYCFLAACMGRRRSGGDFLGHQLLTNNSRTCRRRASYPYHQPMEERSTDLISTAARTGSSVRTHAPVLYRNLLLNLWKENEGRPITLKNPGFSATCDTLSPSWTNYWNYDVRRNYHGNYVWTLLRMDVGKWLLELMLTVGFVEWKWQLTSSPQHRLIACAARYAKQNSVRKPWLTKLAAP